tara:strand:+ start:352 stop:1035 length:684 start_codon:yes stop_codon:yes gene_type:complete
MEEVASYKDIVKQSFLEFQSAGLTIADVATSLLITFVISLLIFWLYKKSFRGVLYTHSFNVSLVMISLVTALVIMTISTNLILSLGMVGALSIVRFRTAVKDPLDIVFMFWAIAIGIANGAMQFELAIVGSFFIAIVVVILSNIKLQNHPYLLVMHYKSVDEKEILIQLNKIIKSYKLKSKTVSNDLVELTLEVRVKKHNISFVDEISKINNVEDLGLVSYEGDYVS